MTAAFRFDRIAHEYIDVDTGVVLPHITGMLMRTGWVDDTWYTEESCERGRIVHRLCAEYDLGSIDDPVSVTEWRYGGYLAAHADAMQALQAEILKVEEPAVHPTYHYAGTLDRVVKVMGIRGVLELKSGLSHKAHPLQTALQALLDSVECGIPAEHLGRWSLYLRNNGRWHIEQHRNRNDFTEAQRIIRTCCR